MDRPVARGLLLKGIAVVVLNAVFLVALYGPDSRIWVPPPGPFLFLLVPVVAFTASLFGLWRMWVAMRGPQER